MSIGELELEDILIQKLETHGYQVFNGHTHEALKDNLRLQLEKLNKVRFTDKEFESLFIYINSGDEYARARKLYLAHPMELEYNNGNTTYIKLIDHNWCSNLFQVAHQIQSPTTERMNRFDVTLLVNGLPLVQLELKKPGVAIKNAVTQIKDYKARGAYRGLFKYIQLFVVSNQVDTSSAYQRSIS